MYPQPPVSHKPTNYYWILAICVGLMLVFLLVALRTMSGRLTAAAAEAPVTVAVPSQPLRALASPAAQPPPSAEASTAATPVVPADNGAAIDVDAKALTDAPAVRCWLKGVMFSPLAILFVPRAPVYGFAGSCPHPRSGHRTAP